MIEHVHQSHERLRPPLMVAEIGTGGLGVGYDVTRLPEDSTIVTIDLLRGVGASANHHDARKVPNLYSNRAKQLQQDGQSVASFSHLPVFADGRNAPFEDGTFDYVMLSSVISDPGISQNDAGRLIEEALRITKQDGLVILRDDLTPFITEDRLEQSNAESDKVLHFIDFEDSNEQRRRVRKAISLVDRPEIFRPTIRFIERGDEYSNVPLKIYDNDDWRNKLRMDQLAADKEARKLRRKKILAKIGLAK